MQQRSSAQTVPALRPPPPQTDRTEAYLESLQILERLHRLLLDLVKDEFERLGRSDLTPVQALLIYNLGTSEVTAGELRSRGMYQGSNVSYNLKKLVELGYVHHERCDMDRRAVRVRLTQAGQEVRDCVAQLFARHAEGLDLSGRAGRPADRGGEPAMAPVERFWAEQIRYIY